MITASGIGVEELSEIQRDQFVHYVWLTRALGHVTDWPRFRLDLTDALRAAWALDGVRADRDPVEQDARVLMRLAAAQGLVDRVAHHHDPGRDWEAFVDRLWEGRDELLVTHADGR